MICPCEQRRLDWEADLAASRAEYDRSLDEQYARHCVRWTEQGDPVLTKAEWLAGCFEDSIAAYKNEPEWRGLPPSAHFILLTIAFGLLAWWLS